MQTISSSWLVLGYLLALNIGALAHTFALDPALLPVLAALGTLPFVLWAERHLPQRQARPKSRETRGDLGWLALTALVSDPLAHFFLQSSVALLASKLAWHGPLTAWPIWLSLPFILLLQELGFYWFHRWSHVVPLLWRLHEVHHRPERMHSLNNTRVHPLDLLGKYVLGYAPALLLGAPAEVLITIALVRSVHTWLNHAAIATRPSWLDGWLSTPAAHLWHHSAVRDESHTNYGNLLLVWDRVFGTFKRPTANETPQRLGLWSKDSGRSAGPPQPRVL